MSAAENQHQPFTWETGPTRKWRFGTDEDLSGQMALLTLNISTFNADKYQVNIMHHPAPRRVLALVLFRSNPTFDDLEGANCMYLLL